MVARGPGAVGCAHCRVIGADRACQVCRKQVCERCAGDYTTCDEPSGRLLRLGFRARVRDVDPTGRLGLVSHWRRPLRLLDLRRLRWIGGTDLPRRLVSSTCPPRLVSSGRLLYRDADPELEYAARSALYVRSPAGGEPARVPGVWVSHGSGVSATGDRYWVVTDTQRVAVVRPIEDGWHVDDYEPLRNRVIHAAHVDGERDLLASGSWGEVALHQIEGAQIRDVGYAKTEHEGNVTWVAVAGPWLVLLVAREWLEVRRLGADLSIGRVAQRRTGFVDAASLSRDGRYLALGTRDGLVVRALDTGDDTVFDDHRGQIDLVRFGGADHELVSADTANQLILRPRHAGGYHQPLITVDVPDEPVALAT